MVDREELEKKYKIDLSPAAVRGRVIRDTAILFIAGVAYYIFVTVTPFSYKCYIHEIFGLDCPMCGTTRMMLALGRLDFAKAFHYNQFMFLTLPYVVYEVIYMFYLNESKKPAGKINMIILYIWLILLFVFGVVRNII